jgi:hypothetical protein
VTHDFKKAASFSPSCIISTTSMQGEKHGIDWPSTWGWHRRTNVRSVAQRERQWIFCVVVTNNRYCFDINCIFLAELLLLLVIHSCLSNRGTVNGLCILVVHFGNLISRFNIVLCCHEAHNFNFPTFPRSTTVCTRFERANRNGSSFVAIVSNGTKHSANEPSHRSNQPPTKRSL